LVLLEIARAFAATGNVDLAAQALERARSRLLERAARIGDPDQRRSFLERVPENADTLAGRLS
jgi:hypothetical protein